MEKRSGGGKLDETDSSPGVEHFQQMTSDGSEVQGENGHSSRGKGKSRKNRIIFNAAQLNALERLFNDVAYPDLDLRMKIAERLEIDESRVTVWFQNRRAKYRRTSQQKTNDTTPTSQDNYVISPAATQSASASPANSQQITTDSFIQSIPVSGVEFNTWVNHSHSGDQSTVVHQLRHPEIVTDMPTIEQRRFDEDSSFQKRTLDWLHSQSNNHEVPPCNVDTVTNHVEVQRQEECKLQRRESPQREKIKTTSKNSGEVKDPGLPTTACNTMSQHYQQSHSGCERDVTSNELPPNRDVLELRENHLSDAMKRLSATRGGQFTDTNPSMFGMNHLNWPRYSSNIQHHSQPFLPEPREHFAHQQNVYYDPRFGAPTHHPHVPFNPPDVDDVSSLPSQGGWQHNVPRVSPYVPRSSPQEFLEGTSPRVNEVEGSRPHSNKQNSKYIKEPATHHENINRRKRRRYSSDDSGEELWRNRNKRRKKYRKRRTTNRRTPNTTELPLHMLADSRRRTAYNSDSDNTPVSNRGPRQGTLENKSRKGRKRESSSFEEAATSSKSEKYTSSTTVFSSTSDSDFEIPYCKQTKPLKSHEKQKKRVKTDKVSHVLPLPLQDTVSTRGHQEGSAPYKTQSPFHYDAAKKVDPPYRHENAFQTPSASYSDPFSERHTERGFRNDTSWKHAKNDGLTDIEHQSMLSYLFGPGSPDIPVGTKSDEERLSLKGRKSSNEDILSESLKLAHMCNSPTSTELSSDLPGRSPYNPLGIEAMAATSNQQFPKQHQVGHVTAFQRDGGYNVTQKQYTLHYGDKASISSYNRSVTTKPRGIIRPVPQRHSAMVDGGQRPPPTESTSYNKQDQSESRQSGGRVTGTVRPWCDDYPRATSNPSQDVSRPVREPVPMEGPPPNKICTMVKDAISPVDLLAKYLTWTGTCYVAQQQKF